LKRNANWSKFAENEGKQLPNLMRWFNYLSSLPAFAEFGAKKVEEVEKQKSLAGSTFNYDSLDLPGAKEGAVVTRFPPEPSGYLHIGHVKAALLNNFYATHYKGKLIIRFDDTNPAKEKEEFVQSILQDLAVLGLSTKIVSYTSDYFVKLAEYAEQLIKSGLAYVDNLDKDTIRKNRFDGIPSPNRENSVEENLRLFREMLDGTEEGVKCVLRGKIDMQNANKVLRDPALFRCSDTPHHRTGTKFKAYPTYDFACPIVDSLEGVTHALRSSEYHDRNPLYNWVADSLKLRRPFIQDFSRLNFKYILLSKRKLQTFVTRGQVSGWDDPRFPTIQGMLRRGLTVDALREFTLSQGASKSLNLMEVDKLWAINKKIIDPIVPRYTAIAQDAKCVFVLADGPTTPTHKSVPRHKKNPDLGNKIVTYFHKVLLEREDVLAMKEGEEVTLMDWGNAIVKSITTDADGNTIVDGHLHLEGNFKNTEKKLTWLPAIEDLVPVLLEEFDHLITKEKMEEDDNLDDFIRTPSRYETNAIGDANLRNLQKGDKIQLERRGYFICDAPFVANKPIVLINIPDGHTTKATSVIAKKVVHAKEEAKKKDTKTPAKN
jgi:glutamyl-tRNA synthetase